MHTDAKFTLASHIPQLCTLAPSSWHVLFSNTWHAILSVPSYYTVRNHSYVTRRGLITVFTLFESHYRWYWTITFAVRCCNVNLKASHHANVKWLTCKPVVTAQLHSTRQVAIYAIVGAVCSLHCVVITKTNTRISLQCFGRASTLTLAAVHPNCVDVACFHTPLRRKLSVQKKCGDPKSDNHLGIL